MQYLPNSPQSRARMLETVGRSRVEELFSQIPESVRLKRALDLPGPLSEVEILDFFRDAARQSGKDYVSFLGAGAYRHHRPAAVDSLLSRGEFFTAYTPYQAEIAQGTLQAIFEFQSLICLLTGMEVSNASLYDGSTAMTEAVLMALRITRRRRVLVARSVHPEYRQVLGTYLRQLDTEITEAPFAASGEVNLEQLERDLAPEPAAVVIQSPNFFGILEDYGPIAELAHRHGALLIVSVTEPLSLAIAKPPAGADIVCGEGQSLRGSCCLRRALPRDFSHATEICSPNAGTAGGPDSRFGKPDRICDHSRHPRAAYPPREGHLEYLYQSISLRPDSHDLSLPAR